MTRNLIFFLICFMTVSCNRIHEDSYERAPTEVVEIPKDTRRKERVDTYKSVEENGFSKGVKEVIEWYDYKSPLLLSYEPILKIDSDEAFQKLLDSGDPLEVKALYLIYSDYNGLDKFKNLEYLRINSFSEFPDELYELSKLKVFIASHSTGVELKEEFLGLKNLKHLSLFCNVKIPEAIHKLENLETLQLGSWDYQGLSFESIFRLSNLKSLWIHSKDVSNLKGISNLKKLEFLDINKADEEICKEISLMKNLTGLIIRSSSVKKFPVELNALQNIVALRLGSNMALRSAPIFISRLKNLEYLDLNGFSNLSKIPIEYNSIYSLKQFDLSGNPLLLRYDTIFKDFDADFRSRIRDQN